MNSFLKKILPLLLLVLLLFVPIMSSASTEGDLSRPGSECNETLNRADVLEYVVGIRLCDEEREYLNSIAGEIVYDTGITTSLIFAELDKDESTLSVSAKPYSYTSADLTEVVWIPESAELSGVEKPLVKGERDRYFAVFDNVTDESEESAVIVTYTLKINISASFANSLVNRAYIDAPIIKSDFEKKSALYSLESERYNRYLDELREYNAKKALYDEYILEYTEYSENLALYEEYLSDLEEYEKQKEAYEKYCLDIAEYEKDYSLYAKYLNEYKLYRTEYSEYEAYLNNVTKYRSQLYAVELANVKMTELNRSALAAINGNLVDSVLAQRESLESPVVNAPVAVADMAGEATERLRALLADYFALETEEARYAYYSTYYEQLRDNFVKLFISLDYLYGVGPIRSYVYETEKEEKFRILLAQLYYISASLSDTPIKSVPASMVAGTNGASGYKQFTYKSDYMTADGYKLLEILGEPPITDTDSATPYNAPFPIEVAEPKEPEKVLEPTRPVRVPAPNEVEEVPHPGTAPTQIENPGEAPTEVKNPGEAPTLTEIERNLILAYEDGKLSNCNLNITKDFDYTVKKTVEKKFVNVESVNVTFIVNGSEIGPVTVDVGTAVAYTGAVPQKAEDARASYEFIGWADRDGNPVSLNSVCQDLELYPRFLETIKEYEITWIVEGTEKTVSFPYGTLPSYGDTPMKPETDTHKFTFLGWDKELVAVSGQAQYTAKFSSEYIVPTSGGGALLSFSEGVLNVDFSASFDSEFLIEEIVSRAHGACPVKLITSYAEIELSFSTVKSLGDAGAVSLKFVSEKRLGGYSYSVIATDADGNSLTLQSPVKLTTRTDLVYNERLCLYRLKPTGERGYTKYQLSEGALKFSALVGEEYVFEYEYSAIATSTELVKITLPSGVISAGSSVGAVIEPKEGMRLVRLYYRDSNGEERELESSRFEMPESDIVLIAEVDYVKYRITFSSDGKAVSSRYYKAGENPIVPESPKKPSQNGVSYVFRCWSPEIGEVSEEMTYNAVFDEVPMVEDQSERFDDTNQKKLITCVILGMAIGVLTVTAGVLIKRRKYR